MTKSLKTIASLLCGIALLGCNADGTNRWGGSPWGKGSVDRQKARAQTFDPFPLNDIGPEVAGGRPRGFEDPLAEPQRNELTSRPIDSWNGYGR